MFQDGNTFIHAPIKCVHNFEVKVDLGKVLAVHLIRISNHIPIKTHTSLSLSLSQDKRMRCFLALAVK